MGSYSGGSGLKSFAGGKTSGFRNQDEAAGVWRASGTKFAQETEVTAAAGSESKPWLLVSESPDNKPRKQSKWPSITCECTSRFPPKLDVYARVSFRAL